VNTLRNGSIQFSHDRICHKIPMVPFGDQKPFNESIRRIAAGSHESIILPPASRTKRVRDRELEVIFNKLAERDLDLQRLGGGFAAASASGIKNTALTQMFAATGSSETLTGSGWHCDICNNFVVQVKGVKKWIFVGPEHSIYMRPSMPGGKTAIAGGHGGNRKASIPYLPREEVIITPGDFMYVPEWHWHQVENIPGFSIGIVSRECNLLKNMKQNALFTSLIMANHAVLAWNDPEARLRLISGITGRSMMVNDTASPPPQNAV